MTNKQTNSTVREVYEFWNTEACGTHFVNETPGTPAFYEAYRKFRYQTEWHIPLLVPFKESKNRSVLEIGCGNGADGVLFASNGAHYTGVDLTDMAVQATRKHFEAVGLPGKFKTENAEALSFPNETFDIVYSHGVLHHTQNPKRTFDEVYRVLKPGGQAIIMLYHRNSFNYYFRIMGYMRLRAILYTLAKYFNWNKDRQGAALRNLAGVRGNTHPSIWEIHYHHFLQKGWNYFKAQDFVHHCTDGPECPYAFVYSPTQVRKDFASFSEIETKVAHFPLRKSKWLKWVPLPIEKWLAGKIGWYLFVYAKK